MQIITITGQLGADAELRSTQGGDDVCSFNVAVNQGYGDRKTTNWFRVSYWGKRGRGLQPYLLKGGKVAVVGELEIGEYNGKTQYNIRANDVDLTGRPKSNDGLTHQNQNGFGGGRAPADDLDDEIPFLSADFALEYPLRRVI